MKSRVVYLTVLSVLASVAIAGAQTANVNFLASSDVISTGTYYTFVNEASGQCATDPNAGGSGTAVEQTPCSTGSTNQEWKFTASSVSGYYEIATYNSGTLAWNVVGDSSAAGTGIQLYAYSAQSNEEFEPELLSTGYYEFIDHNSGLCVSDPNGSTSSGQQLEIETCNQAASESWTLAQVSTAPGFTLTPSASSLAVLQGSTATDTITVADTNGFTGNVTLAATGLPSGVTAAFGTNPTSGSSVLTFTASSTATTGVSTVTLTGTSGSTTATTTLALSVNPPSGDISTSAYYTFTNASSSQCATDPNAGGSGASVEQTTCSTGNLNQEWKFTASPVTGYYEIATYNSSTLAWNVVGDSSAAGSGIQLYSYSAQSNEEFEPKLLLSTGYYEFIDHNSGLCVSDPNSSTTSGQQLEIETCNSAANESWTLTDLSPSSGPTATTTVISANPTSTTVGNTVTLSATVTGTSGTPTGTVSFYYTTDLLYTAALSGGSGSFTASTNGLPAGTYGVSATYSGDANNLASSTPSNVNVTLKNNTTSTVLTATPNPAAAGATITLEAVVSRTSPGAAGNPGGTVNFYVGTTLLNSTPVKLNSEGQAIFSASSSGIAAGSYPVQAKYSGENGDDASTSNTVTVVLN